MRTGSALSPTEFLDFQHPDIDAFVREHVAAADDARSRAVALFYAVRDGLRYDPYTIDFSNTANRASTVLASGRGWCVPKAVLLTACMRNAGIPARIGLADVRNHLTTEKLKRRLGGIDTFYDHGYTAIELDGRWLKLVPAFNIELCERFGVLPTEFDGTRDALYQPFDADGRLHMEYLVDHGTFDDLPLARIEADFRREYPAMFAPSRHDDTDADLFDQSLPAADGSR